MHEIRGVKYRGGRGQKNSQPIRTKGQERQGARQERVAVTGVLDTKNLVAVDDEVDTDVRMNDSEIFLKAVLSCNELPKSIRDFASISSGISATQFDVSYMEFLEEQIQLGALGPQWNAILIRRRDGLLPYCDVPLLSGSVRMGRGDVSIKVDPRHQTVVYWELSEDASEGG